MICAVSTLQAALGVELLVAIRKRQVASLQLRSTVLMQ